MPIEIKAPQWFPFQDLRAYWPVLWELSLRTLKGPFRASRLGWAWLVLHPLLMMSMYTVVFARIFGGRYGDVENETVWDYAIGVYLSLTVFGFASDVVGSSPTILDASRNTLRRSTVPAKVIVAAHVMAALLRFLPNLMLSLAAVLLFSRMQPTVIWIAPMLVGLLILLLGLAYLLSSLGAINGDVRQLAGPLCTVLLWSSAVFYSAGQIPEVLRWIQWINPFLQAVELTRQSAMWGASHAHLASVTGLIWAFAVTAHIVGAWLLQRLRPRFTE